MLKGAIPHGQLRDFAINRLEITPVYWSNLLDPSHHPPSPELARRIADALPLDVEQREGVLEHMLLAIEAEDQQATVVRNYETSMDSFYHLHTHLLQAYDDSLLTRNDSRFQTPLIVVCDIGQLLLNTFHPHIAPLFFVETCLVVHNAQMALNRWADALYLCHLAEVVLDQLDPFDFRHERKRMNHLKINVFYAKSITYRNRKVLKQAQVNLQSALTMLQECESPQKTFWLSHLDRELITILGAKPRFILGEIEGLADQLRSILEKASKLRQVGYSS